MMEERRNTACIRCLAAKHLEDCPPETPEDVKRRYLFALFDLMKGWKADEGAPVIEEAVIRLREEVLGVRTDYSQINRDFNQVMLSLEDEIREIIERADDPVEKALQYVLAGNYIDFGALPDVSKDQLMALLEKAGDQEIDPKVLSDLKKDLEGKKRLVYITDNCGEIVLDKLLIMTLQKADPDLDVTILVRGMPILNDATMEDALETGLDRVGRVMGNGSAIPGTHLPAVSPESRKVLEKADVLISKGQGNYETLRGCGLNIYYLFLCKCGFFMERFHKKKFEGIFIRETGRSGK